MGEEGEGGREGVVQSVIDWKCKLAEGGTSTATTRQMAIGQRVRVSKFANRGNKFDFVLEIIKSPPTKLPRIPSMTPVDVAIPPASMISLPPFSRMIKPRKPSIYHHPIYRDSYLKSTICHVRPKVCTPLLLEGGDSLRRVRRVQRSITPIYIYIGVNTGKYNRPTIVLPSLL